MSEIINIAMILLFGTLCSALAYRLKVSNVFFLILAGMIFGIFNFAHFSNSAIITISELTLVLIVFNSTAKLNFKKILKYSKRTLRLNFTYLAITLAVLTPLTLLFFDLNPSTNISILLASLFACLMYGIDPAVALSMLNSKKNEVVQVLEIESLINTPITVILSLIILRIIEEGTSRSMISENTIMVLQQLFVPLGVGVVIGTIKVHIMKHNYFEELSHLTVITSAIIVYVLSEIMNGNGVLGVTTFGLIFGNFHIDHKIELEKFGSIFANTLKILVFVLLGTVIVNYSQYRTFDQLVYGSILFIVYIIIRFIAIEITLKKFVDFRKKLFMTLNMPKGIDVAVVLLIVIASISDIKGLDTIRNISLLFVLYSIVVSTVSSLFNEWFFEKVKKKNKTT